MRSSVKVALVMLMASPLGLQAADAKLGTCESSVGVWEFIGQPGRGLLTKAGAKYQVMWIANLAGGTGATEAGGQAAECSCQATAGKLIWKCRIAFSLRPAEVGADQIYEWTVAGDTLKSSLVGPDGKPTEGVGIRRPQ